MKIIGIVLIVFLVLWLLLHKRKDQETYHRKLSSNAQLLPRLAQHFVGID
jgi:hypothetical protein